MSKAASTVLEKERSRLLRRSPHEKVVPAVAVYVSDRNLGTELRHLVGQKHLLHVVIIFIFTVNKRDLNLIRHLLHQGLCGGAFTAIGLFQRVLVADGYHLICGQRPHRLRAPVRPGDTQPLDFIRVAQTEMQGILDR